MSGALVITAGILCIVTALIHSILGEKRLIAPLLAERSGVMQHDLARQVTRFAWHWSTALWFVVGAVLVVTSHDVAGHFAMITAIGTLHVAAGLLDGYFSKGRHIGWPFITLIGLLALSAPFFT